MNSLFYEKTIQDRIRKKLVEAEATSSQKAVTIEEAKFDYEEQNWLICIAGGLFSAVKKNKRQTVPHWRLIIYKGT